MQVSSRMRVVLGALTAIAMIAGCKPTGSSSQTTPNPGSPLTVYATFSPLAYFAERIAGGEVEVICPLPAGADPATWRPNPQTIAAFQNAGLILTNGAAFESWVANAPLPRSRVVDTTAGFALDLLDLGESTHSHGPTGEHSHSGIDGHTWLDPINAMQQAHAIRDAMKAAFPGNDASFAAGYNALAADLRGLDESLRELSPMVARARLLASHPAYNYLAARYGWSVTSMDLDPDASPGAMLDAALDEMTGPAIMLWESEPNAALRRVLHEQHQITSVVFSPGENLAEGESYLLVMQQNVARLREALGG